MGRRELRAELEATWMVYDARRPIRREDFEAASESAADGAERAPAPPGAHPVESAAPSEVGP